MPDRRSIHSVIRPVTLLLGLLCAAASIGTVRAIAQAVPAALEPVELQQHPPSEPVPAANGEEASAFIRAQGNLPGYAGQTASLRFSIYASADGKAALWSEEQTVKVDGEGHYTVLLGDGSALGVPASLFSTGEPAWLGVNARQQPGEPEISRSLLASVPYAMKAVDAASLAGRPATDYVTRDELSIASPTLNSDARPAVAATVTGSGTTGYLPLWTATSSLGNSAVFQTGTGTAARVGINTATPASTLDVAGASTLRGSVLLPSTAATTAAGVSSPQLWLAASSFQAGSSAVAQAFGWQVLPLGNNTAAPSSDLALLFAAGSANPAATGLTISPKGIITFAPGQTFPVQGTAGGTITGVTAGTGLTGGGTSGKVTLKLDPTKVPQLGTANVFTANQSFTGTESFQNLVQIAVNTTPSAPAYPLDIEGGPASQPMAAIVTKGTDAALTLKNNGPGGREYWIDSGSKGAGVGAGNFAVWDAQLGARLVIDPAGEVGIGTVTPAGNQLAVVTSVDNAINATATNGWAGHFTNNSTTQATVNSTNTGLGNAGYFANNSPTRVALAGVNASTDLNAVGTYGSVTNGKAVYGVATLGTGVYGTSTHGFGVEGNSSSNIGVSGQSSGNVGVYGVSTAMQSAGVTGSSPYYGVIGLGALGGSIIGQSYSQGAGVWGDTGSGDVVGVKGTADNGTAGYFVNATGGFGDATISAINEGGGDTVNVILGVGPKGACAMAGDGGLSCTGQLKALVSTARSRQVETYSVQSAENWLEDYGSGSLTHGSAKVTIEPAFAEAVNTGVEYHIFLTPKGDCKGLYVDHETATSFEVHELGAGTSQIGFDYKIVAKRTGHETERLTDVTERVQATFEPLRRRAAEAQGRERSSKPVALPATISHPNWE